MGKLDRELTLLHAGGSVPLTELEVCRPDLERQAEGPVQEGMERKFDTAGLTPRFLEPRKGVGVGKGWKALPATRRNPQY